ncbi:catalase [Ilumatobacter sp.]|uniref:catalase n=1 Tax=Ilumatobacter sp. TaxID=1967498 RepID=UPI003C4137F8
MAPKPTPKKKRPAASKKTAQKHSNPSPSGGETHQTVADGGDGSSLTTQQGVVISDDQNTLTVGDRGPQLLEDFVLREKLFHFDHERIPERVVHARGYGAKGTFECYDALTDITMASLFAATGKKTDVFVRFSTVAGNKGSADLARDVRGFAVKFYTDAGNWDLVGNNIPVFFIQDAMKFPDLVHAAKPEPHCGFPQAQTAHDNFWDFVSLMPESTHMLMWIMSDRAIPRSFRFMEGFGVHTFRLVDEGGASTYVKFHWKPMGGVQSVTWNEAVKINGADPDFHRRDLWNSIDSGDFPEWELGVQMFDDDFADSFDFDVLDSSKLIPEEQIPVTPIGKMTLNQNVDNFFTETEQVAFCTANVVPGIDFTNDPLLQGRNFSYLDTQLKRLGSPNFTHIPVNAPRCPVMHFQQDGHMSTQAPEFGRANYEPNSWGSEGGPREDPERGYRSFAAAESGDKRRVRAESFADHYSQARQFYDSQTDVERNHIVDAFVFELSKVETVAVQERMLAGLRNVSDDLAQRVADGLGLALPDAADAARPTRTDLEPSPALSMLADPLESFAGRKIGVLVAEGTDPKVLAALRKAAKNEGALMALVAPKKHGVMDSAGSELEIAEKIDGGPSVVFDAIAVVLNDEQAERLALDAVAKDFVSDAHAHCKFVAYTGSSTPLFDAVGVTDFDDGYHDLGTKSAAATFVRACRQVRHWERQPAVDQT